MLTHSISSSITYGETKGVQQALRKSTNLHIVIKYQQSRVFPFPLILPVVWPFYREQQSKVEWEPKPANLIFTCTKWDLFKDSSLYVAFLLTVLWGTCF